MKLFIVVLFGLVALGLSADIYDCEYQLDAIRSIKRAQNYFRPVKGKFEQTERLFQDVKSEYEKGGCEKIIAPKEKKDGCVRYGCRDEKCGEEPALMSPCEMIEGADDCIKHAVCARFGYPHDCGYVYPPKYYECLAQWKVSFAP